MFQQLLFIFPDFNFFYFLLFIFEIILTKTLEKNIIQIISSIVLRICMMNLYVKSYSINFPNYIFIEVVLKSYLDKLYSSQAV